jgi:hypothetical protein
MLFRQAIAALLLTGAIFSRFSVWFAFVLLLAGYDMAAHLAVPLASAIGGLTEFGLGRWAYLVMFLVRQMLELVFDVGAVIVAYSPAYIHRWQLGLDCVGQILLTVPAFLAQARASGDSVTDLGALTQTARPPISAWIIATIAVTIALLAITDGVRGIARGQGMMPGDEIAMLYVVNASLGAMTTLMRIAIAAAFYRAARFGPIPLGAWFE